MPYPFELAPDQLASRLDEMVDVTFGTLQSQFLVLPRGSAFIEYAEFQDAYETLKRATSAFRSVTEDAVIDALKADSLSLVVLRTMLGISPVEWADLARSDLRINVGQGAARTLDVRVRKDRQLLSRAFARESGMGTLVRALVRVAVNYLTRGAEGAAVDTVHRLAKVDTSAGLSSLQRVAAQHVPYAVLLYERYLGRPFASHRDSISEMVGDVMESAIEERLARAEVTFRKTKRAERVEGFEQAPDFFVPTEFAPAVIIEAKITGDDGTARDKVARILRLAHMRDERVRSGATGFELVACIDGRGFGVRRRDMKDILLATLGKVFTLSTLDHLIPNTRLKEFCPRNPRP